MQGEPLLPEAGVVSEHTYTSLYFGFSFELPIPLQGHRLMLPIQPPGEHALLAIGFQSGKRYGTLVITAGGAKTPARSNDLTPAQVQQRLEDLARSKPGPVTPGPLDYSPNPIVLKHVDKHSGDVRGTQFSAQVKDYNVRFTVQTNDKAFLEKSRDVITMLQPYCQDEDGTLITSTGKVFNPPGTFFEGPTIPTGRIDAAIRSRPAEQTIPQGYTALGEYHLPQLEFVDKLPTGWSITGAAPEQAEYPPVGVDPERLDNLWQSCARTLFRAAPSGAPKGADAFVPSVELRALDQACLALPAPASSTDWFGAESLGEYLQMLGRFGKISSNRLVQIGGHTFSVYQGTVRGAPPIHDLKQRAAQMIAATRYRKLILAWCWSAATESELKLVPATNVTFGDGPAIAIGPTVLAVH